MGTFRYESDTQANFDDRLLLHLQHVIAMKLRRGESFTFTWISSAAGRGDRHVSVWLNPRSALTFSFFGSRPAQLNPAWLEALAFTANSTAGLQIVPEPARSTAGARVDAGV
jgi:hypothetical protein